MLGAARVRAEAEAWSGQQTTALEKMQADKLEARARELIPQQLREYGAGGELVPNKLAGVPAAEFRSTVRGNSA